MRSAEVELGLGVFGSRSGPSELRIRLVVERRARRRSTTLEVLRQRLGLLFGLGFGAPVSIAMGNQQIGYGNPNVVEVSINPGGGCCFQIDPHVQDARLAHFVTADDYAQKIEKANHVFRQQGACGLGPCAGFWACMIGVVIIISVMMALFFR